MLSRLTPRPPDEVIDITDSEQETDSHAPITVSGTHTPGRVPVACLPGGPSVDLWMVMEDGSIIPQV